MSDPTLIGTLITSTQTNITSVGTLNILNVSGTATLSDIFSSGVSTFSSVYFNSLDIDRVRIGNNAGTTFQSIGAIAFGVNTGFSFQGTNAIAVGNDAGKATQRDNSIAIGVSSNPTNQASGSISIGYLAGSQQANNSIVINAQGTVLTGSILNSTYIAPVRNVSQSNVLGYDTSTYELTYWTAPSLKFSVQFFRADIGANQTVSINTNYLIKWTGGTSGTITGLTNNTTTGIITLTSPGIYFIHVFINISSNANGTMTLYIPTSVDNGGVAITATNFSTATRYCNYSNIFTCRQMSSFYNIRVTADDVVSPKTVTFGVGFFQSKDANFSLWGTSGASTRPSNISISRIF